MIGFKNKKSRFQCANTESGSVASENHVKILALHLYYSAFQGQMQGLGKVLFFYGET